MAASRARESQVKHGISFIGFSRTRALGPAFIVRTRRLGPPHPEMQSGMSDVSTGQSLFLDAVADRVGKALL